MSFEDVMGAVMQWSTATEALAAIGAELALLQPGAEASPEVVAALQGVSAAAGLGDLSELPPPQREMMLGMIRLFLHSAYDTIENPGKPPVWDFTDTAILDGWGRGSAMLPAMFANTHPDLANATSFLDVGTGVGLLAIGAANVWRDAKIVGIDPYDVALQRARTNVEQAGLGDRIALRQETLADIADVDAFDCVWIPTFFVTEDALQTALPTVLRATQPGGWIVLGASRAAPDPVAAAVTEVRWIRGGGSTLDADRSAKLLEQAGFTSVQIVPPQSPVPVDFVIGQRPTS